MNDRNEVPSDILEDIAYLSRSENRIEVLETLTRRPHSTRELREVTETSKATVNRILNSDFQFSETTGPEPTGTDLINRYFSRLLRTAGTDGTVADAFHRVVIMEERPTSLFRPGIMWRVLTPSI